MSKMKQGQEAVDFAKSVGLELPPELVGMVRVTTPCYDGDAHRERAEEEDFDPDGACQYCLDEAVERLQEAEEERDGALALLAHATARTAVTGRRGDCRGQAMSHPIKMGHARVIIDLPPGQTAAQALGLGVASSSTSSKADSYLRDLKSCVEAHGLPALPDSSRLWSWLRDISTATQPPEDGAEFWRTGLREAALPLVKSHLAIITPESVVRAVYEAGHVDGQSSAAQVIGYDAAAAEEVAYERGRVAGLRAVVWVEETGSGHFACAPGFRELREKGWNAFNSRGGEIKYFPTREEAQAAADAAPNWWEAGQ